MRLYPECGPCMLRRVLMFCENESEETRYRVVREVCGLFSERISPDMSTTALANERNRILEEITKNKDPMRHLKDESMDAALELYPRLKERLMGLDEGGRFRTALRMALAGNIMEFGARDHEVNLNRLEEEIMEIVEGKAEIDDSDRVYEKVKKAKRILYVTDNAGELVLDKLFIDELRNYANVTVAPLSRPVQDDASVEDVKRAGIDGDILPRGDFIGVWFERTPAEFQRAWKEADLIIAKGMACYETLVDRPDILDGKVALLMKAKCRPVAEDIRVPLGASVVKVL